MKILEHGEFDHSSAAWEDVNACSSPTFAQLILFGLEVSRMAVAVSLHSAVGRLGYSDTITIDWNQ